MFRGVAVLLLLLVLLPATETRPPQRLTSQATFAVDASATPLGIIADKIVVESANGVTGFDMATGARVWEVPRDNAPVTAQLLPEAGLVLVTVANHASSDSAVSAAEPTTFAVEADTGVRRWSSPGWMQVVGDLVVVVRADQTMSVWIHDLATFLPRWQPPQGIETWLVDADRHTLLVLSDKGRLTEHRLPDGAPVRAGDVKVPQYSTLDILPGRIRLAGDEEEFWVDRESFLPATPVSSSSDHPCGLLVCRAESNLYFVDARTGAVLRMLDQGSKAFSTAAGLVVAAPGPEPGIGPAVELADSATGATESSLKDWWVTISQRGEVSPVLFQPVSKPDHTHLALLSKDGLVSLGAVPGKASRCLYRAPLIACRTTPGEMGVWRVADRAR